MLHSHNGEHGKLSNFTKMRLWHSKGQASSVLEQKTEVCNCACLPLSLRQYGCQCLVQREGSVTQQMEKWALFPGALQHCACSGYRSPSLG